MADDVEFGPSVAESTLPDDHPMGIDPRLYSADGSEPAPVWAASQRLREVIERQQARPPDADRDLLVTEIQRQLVTLGLYRELARQNLEPADPRRTLSLYVILFPGEARDNTGIKDLNDKVLGYKLCSEFIAARQAEIRAIFPLTGNASGPRFVTVGQDYKTASVLAVGKTPEEFAKNLALLDERLSVHLLGYLDKAEKDTTDAARLGEIRKLRQKLRKKGYRFDYLFGVDTLPIAGRPLDLVFRLVTEALKGAGTARFAAKGRSLRYGITKALARGRGADAPDKGDDPRGRVYQAGTFLKILKAADDIKKLAAAGPNRDQALDFRSVYVDTVWTSAFLPYQKVFFGNPDVIRDVRKKALKRPPVKDGVKFDFKAQVELLELWLVALNAMDYVKEFVSTEFPRMVERQHTQGLLLIEELFTKSAAISWPRLARFLTRDIRDTFHPVAIQGTASEYQFYSHAADYPEQIFFAMDIRDLGVELMAFYELAQMNIVKWGFSGFDLMVETFRSTDAIVQRKRFTYDKVVEVFHRYYGQASAAGAAAEAAKAFGTTLRTDGAMPPFGESVRVMLGGDEVFVAAHPYYARCVHRIVAELVNTRFNDRPLNMRTGVAYSNAPRVRGEVPAAYGPLINPAQRAGNQKSHDKALKLATDSHGLLKPLERSQRRIERLIDILEGSPKKKDLAPPFLKRLGDLRLLDVFVRAQHAYAPQVSAPTYARVHRLMKAGDLGAALDTTLVDLVDLTGRELDGRTLTKQAADLEAEVRRAVGTDNFHVDGPPVTKMPSWMKKAIDHWTDFDEEEEKKRRKHTA